MSLFWREEMCCFEAFYGFLSELLYALRVAGFCCQRAVICDVTAFLTCFAVWSVLLDSFSVLRGAMLHSLCVLLLAPF